MKKRIFIAVLTLALAVPLSLAVSAWAKDTAWLGIYTQTVDKDLQEAFDLPSDRGVVVKNVISDSPADEAGLSTGDIILKIDGTATDDADLLTEIVTGHKPGDEIDIEVLRKGKNKTIKTVLGDREEIDRPMAEVWNRGSGPHTYSKTWQYSKQYSNDTYIGVALETLGKQLGDYFGVGDKTGVLISEVYEDSPASKAGLKAGDVILGVDGRDIESVSDVQEAVGDKKEGDQIELSVLRDRKEQKFTLDIEEAPASYGSNIAPFMTPNFDWDNFNMNLPKMKGLFRGYFDDEQAFDSEKLQEQMQQLQKQLQEMKEELQNMKDNQ